MTDIISGDGKKKEMKSELLFHATTSIAAASGLLVLTESIFGCLCTRSWVANRGAGNRIAGHASSEFGRFAVNMKVIMRCSKYVHRRVTAWIPIKGEMIDSSDRFDLVRQAFIIPTECEVRHSVRGHLRRHDGRIALSRRIRRDWKGVVVLEREFEFILTAVIDVL